MCSGQMVNSRLLFFYIGYIVVLWYKVLAVYLQMEGKRFL